MEALRGRGGLGRLFAYLPLTLIADIAIYSTRNVCTVHTYLLIRGIKMDHEYIYIYITTPLWPYIRCICAIYQPAYIYNYF